MSVQRRHWSPEPEHITGVHAKAFRHDPYHSPNGMLFCYEATPADAYAEADPFIDTSVASEPPVGTRHPELWGRVSFVPYPNQEFHPDHAEYPHPDEELSRVFLGQLPYFVTDMQLSWLCYTFGGFHIVSSPERIMKRQPNGERLPTGCIHAYATRRAVEEMAAGMHKRMLVDDTGVWHAQTSEELDALSTYVAMMKSDRNKRVPGRPYDTVVVQLATSTFVPMFPMPLTEFPMEFRGPKPQRKSPPPPSYDHAVATLPPPYHAATTAS